MFVFCFLYRLIVKTQIAIDPGHLFAVAASKLRSLAFVFFSSSVFLFAFVCIFRCRNKRYAVFRLFIYSLSSVSFSSPLRWMFTPLFAIFVPDCYSRAVSSRSGRDVGEDTVKITGMKAARTDTGEDTEQTIFLFECTWSAHKKKYSFHAARSS